MKRIIAYGPVFSFTISYILYQYLSSKALINTFPFQVLYTILILILLLIGCSFIANRIAKNHNQAGLVLLLTAELLFFSEKFFFISGIISCFLILLWVGIAILRKKKILLEHISFLLILLSFGLIFYYLSLISPALINVPWSLYKRQITESKEIQSSSIIIPSEPPDIYYIVLDGYVRSDVLEELYGYDNSNFTNYLLDKGFIIPENNHSNYAITPLSLASTLNMQYIQTLFPDAESYPFWWLMSPFIKNSQVEIMLEEGGYKTVTVAVDWDFTNINNADIHFKPFPIQLNEFNRFLIMSSPISVLSPAVENSMMLSSYPSHRKTVNYAFEILSKVPDIEGLKFVFVHIVSPHPPFVFDKDGQPVEPAYNFSFNDGNFFPGNRDQYKIGYVNQIQFINSQLEKTVNSILDKSDNPPIIILLADHGSRMLTDFTSSDNSCIRELFSNFAAFYLPGQNEDTIPTDITSVNVFRIIFDKYFGSEFGILDNGYYFYRDNPFIYHYEDIAMRLNIKCENLP